MYKFILSVVCVVSLSAEMVGGIAIVVKDRGITLYELKQEMQNSNINLQMAVSKLIREKLEDAEVKERKINVTSSEVYDDIKEAAKRNNMSVNDFYEATLNTKGMNSAELKVAVKKKLLSKKLHSAISYSHISQPTETEIKEYFELHKADYKHPSSFTVVIYQAKDKSLLVQKIQNPMFNSPQVGSNEQVLPYNRISPELAKLLEETPINGFTPIIPDGKGAHMSFYIKDIQNTQEAGLDALRNQIENTIVSQKREQVLSDYFARLQHNADIKIIRMPE